MTTEPYADPAFSTDDSPAVVFQNARVVLSDRVTPACDLLVKQGRIDRIGEGHVLEPGTTVVEARGLIVAPGLIDIHCHSDGRHSFFNPIRRLPRVLMKHYLAERRPTPSSFFLQLKEEKKGSASLSVRRQQNRRISCAYST